MIQVVRHSSSSTMGWKWFIVFGSALMLIGAGMCIVGCTCVLLPYDYSFVGLTPTQLQSTNPYLLPFMEHDRVSYAGTIVSLGVLYTQLAAYGMRLGERWAFSALMLSSLVGFASFFLWLGFGYFDPLHAGLTLLLGGLFLAGLQQTYQHPQRGKTQAVAWRQMPAGQRLFLMIGGGLICGGIAIAYLGVTTVFVPQDLAFLHATATALAGTNPHLLPLIAHDRASFGGALLAEGVGIVLLVVWGMRPGTRWVWWTLAGAGLPGFLTTIGIHFIVGYTDFVHLLPAYGGFCCFAIGLLITYQFCCRPS
jgi:dihydroorotate dehydrogenase